VVRCEPIVLRGHGQSNEAEMTRAVRAIDAANDEFARMYKALDTATE
jgi:hypothetical protein